MGFLEVWRSGGRLQLFGCCILSTAEEWKDNLTIPGGEIAVTTSEATVEVFWRAYESLKPSERQELV